MNKEIYIRDSGSGQLIKFEPGTVKEKYALFTFTDEEEIDVEGRCPLTCDTMEEITKELLTTYKGDSNILIRKIWISEV